METFYCREDFEAVIKRYKKAPADEIEFVKTELAGMCTIRGLDFEATVQDPKALDAIPTRSALLEQLQEQFIETFYHLHKNIPSAHDYMKRIVHRLAPEYEKDPVRVAILKKFVLGAGTDCEVYNISSVIGWAVARMDKDEQTLYNAADEQTKLKMAAEKLDDSIFDTEHRSSELSWKEILLLIKKRDELLRKTDKQKNKKKVINAAGEEIEYPQYAFDCGAIAKSLRTFLGLAENTICSAVDIIDALFEEINRSAKELHPAQSDLAEFAKSLESGFKKHLNQFSSRTKTGSLIKLAENYEDDRRYAKKQKQTGDWKLLTLCEDLAKGAFKTNNRQTRVNLYRFAMMFDMTFSISPDKRDPERDICKNLFEDYYCDNLVRYLGQSPLNLKESSGWENEPSGEGINLKNYAEAIYIYYLYHKDPALTPGQRIMRAEKAIQSCRAAKNDHKAQTGSGIYTEYYTEIFADIILPAKEDQLPKLICDHYPIDDTVAMPIQNASGQITASEFFNESLEALDDGTEADYHYDAIPKDRKDQLEEIASTVSISFDWRIAPLLKKRYCEDPNFIRVVEQLDSRLTEEFDWISGRKKGMLALTLQALYHNSSPENPIKMEALKKLIQKKEPAMTGNLITEAEKTLHNLGFDTHRLSGTGESLFFLGQRTYADDTMNRIIKKVETRYTPDMTGLRKLFTHMLDRRVPVKKSVTRTTVLCLCLFRYLAEELGEINGILSFPNLYNDFASYVNPTLEDCRFQLLHEKNILDMYIILSLFFYVTENGIK